MSNHADITLMIVDDHPLMRDGLGAILSLEEDIRVVAEVGTGAQAVSAYREQRPEVVLMDLLLPDMSGADAIEQICSSSSDARIIVLTSVGGDEQIYRALEAGARGYLFKDMLRADLLLAIRAVHAGRRHIPAQVGSRLAENLPRSDLSPREIEVLQLVASGMRNKEIAYRLSISEATVNAHIKRLFEKLAVSDRTQAVMTALRRGFIHL